MPTTVGPAAVPVPVGGDPADVPADLTRLAQWVSPTSADTVRVLTIRPGNGAPGSVTPAASAAVGYYYLDRSTGAFYAPIGTGSSAVWLQLNPTPTVATVTGLSDRLTTLQQADSSEASARQSGDNQVAQSASNALAGETTSRQAADTALGNRITTEVNDRTAADTAIRKVPDWVAAASYTSGWSNFSNTGNVQVHPLLNKVFLRGLLVWNGGASNAGVMTVLVLPTNARPSVRKTVISASSYSTPPRVDINTDGTLTVTPYAGAGFPNNAFIALDGVSFELDAA